MTALIAPDATPAARAGDALVITGVSKRFGPTLALDNVSLTLRTGEARALIGRNGAGKSTLIAIITGLLHADGGSVSFGTSGVRTAAEAVACVYQRSTLVPSLTAAENIALGGFPTRGGLVNWGEVDRRARELLREWDCEDLAPQIVGDLDPVHRKVVEICRALAGGAEILLLDEPTAGLDADATVRLFDHIAAMRRRGVTVVYVSHYLEEIFQVCDTVTVLRDGRDVYTGALDGMGVGDLVNHMVGEVGVGTTGGAVHAPATVPSPDGSRPRIVMKVDGLAAAPLLERFDVEIAEGECVGLVGLDGSGIFEVAESIAGMRRPDAGVIEVDGKVVPQGLVSRAIDHGIGFLPQDRQIAGFVACLGNEENTTLGILGRIRTAIGLISGRRRRDVYDDLASRWQIKAASGAQFTEELSGGNQQKVALARAFAGKPRVLVLTSPTAGVDVAAKASIFESIRAALATDHRSALIVSADDTEFEICSRLLVMYRGRIVAELTPPWTEATLAAAVQGSTVAAARPTEGQEAR